MNRADLIIKVNNKVIDVLSFRDYQNILKNIIFSKGDKYKISTIHVTYINNRSLTSYHGYPLPERTIIRSLIFRKLIFRSSFLERLILEKIARKTNLEITLVFYGLFTKKYNILQDYLNEGVESVEFDFSPEHSLPSWTKKYSSNIITPKNLL